MMAPLSYTTTNLDRVSRLEAAASPLQESSIPAPPVGAAHVAVKRHEPEQHPELVRFLSTVTFGAGLRVVWESAMQVPSGAAAEGTPMRPNVGAAAFTRVPPGAGLETALDLAAARKGLHEQHWIVAVVSADSLLSHLSQIVVEQLQQVESRLAIIVLDDGKPAGESTKAVASHATSGQYDRLSTRWLADLGLAHHGPVDGRNMASVQVQLRRIFQAQRPALLHLQTREFVGAQAASAALQQPTLAATPPVSAVQPAENGQHAGRGVESLFGFSAEELRAERELVLSRRLSAPVVEWGALYAQVGQRSEYLWKWCERGAELTTLPCVLPELFDHAWQTKVLSIILCVLLDDVADHNGREGFLNALLRIVDEPAQAESAGALSHEETVYAAVTRQLAEIYQARLRSYPCHAVYSDLLGFDQLQFSNALRYSHLLNRRPSLLNVVEHDLYLPHNMHMMSFATLDLMCSPNFAIQELGKLREAIWHAQCMGRIGNLLASWRRESAQHDYTSGVFARAVVSGDLTLEQLSAGDPQTIETAIKSGGHEQHFYRRWRHHRRCLRQLTTGIHSVDLQSLLKGHERFFCMHLCSRGLI